MSEMKKTSGMQDPSVIVGAACRVPGATNLHELLDLLDSKRDVQTKMPSDRYTADAFYHPEGANKGTSNAMLGYYLDQPLDKFDAAFFNISGKEAEAMDPQQRLLLEVVYEALENAGITLDEIRGTKTAVFAGSFTYDYQSMTNRDLAHYPKYTVTGTDANAILANRISYVFDLHGPSVQVDTACSSSLTAFHLGVQSLQTGESDMAIICGTALHFDPTIFITMAEFGMLSTDGRCRHFDASGSGYVRGDGVCAVVLKRQRAAELNGDRIRAVIRGTGTNHDGVKEGMTLPNNKAQASLVRSIYAKAGLDPRETGYFEAHGTGTQAGDPREALSIGDVFAAGREDPLYVGSIKTNIGHLEGASGLAGVMKAMLSVERGKILPNMHFNTPNPKIDFEALKIRVPKDTIEWNPANGIRRASINSFGFGGANSHVVLENYAEIQKSVSQGKFVDVAPKRPFLLPLSSHSENGGKLLQQKLAQYINDRPDTLVWDLVHTYSTRRSLHRFRSFAIGNDLKTIKDAATTLSPLASWKQAGKSPRLGFIFTGQGAQWYAMGRQLIEESEFFRSTLAECESVLKTLPDSPSWSILDEMTKPEGESRLSQSEFSQPLCTALQIALVDTLKNWGIEPAAAIGHSSGEIAAAYSAGILSRRDAIICAYYRGLYMSKGRHGTAGSMMAVGLTEAEANLELAPFLGRAGIAAVNSPSSITLSGDKDAILEIKARLDERKVFARLLQVEQAFHSHHMLPLAPGFQQALASTAGFLPKPARISMFSSVTARDSSARPMDGEYWSDNMTGRVRFSDAVTGMVLGEDDQLAVDVLVEIGPHPALKGPTKQTIKSLGVDIDIPYIGSIDRKVPAYESLLACAGQLFSLGYPVDLVAANSEAVSGDDGSITTNGLGKLIDTIPTYSWDHKSFWSETRWNKEYRQRPYRHTILGAPVPGSPSNNPRWRNYIRLSELPWLKDHAIDGSVLFPAAAYFTLAIEALIRAVPANAAHDIVLSDVRIKSALAVPDTEAGVEIMVDLLLDKTSHGNELSYRFTVYSFTDSGATIQNCSGQIAAVPSNIDRLVESAATYEELQLQMQYYAPSEKFYKRLHTLGLQYGDAFKLVNGAFESGDGASVALLDFDPIQVRTGDAELDSCVLHPTFLDASFHAILSALESKFGRSLTDAYVATSCGSLRVTSPMAARRKNTNLQKYWVNANSKVISQRLSSSSIRVCDVGSSEPLIELHDVEFTALGLADTQGQSADAFFRTTWEPVFGFLGSNETEPELSSVDALIACYAHQYPGNSILRIQEDSDTAEISGLYDLLVLNKAYQQELGSRLKPESFIVTEESQPPAENLQLKFRQGALSIWRAHDEAPAPSALTVLLSSSPSEASLSLVRSIENELNGLALSVTTLDKMNDDIISGSNILSLVELDEPNFGFNSQALAQWDTLLSFLSSASANLVWLQRRDELGQSVVRHVSRVARTENPRLQISVLKVPNSYATKHVRDSIQYAFNTSFEGEELEIQDGCLLLPRIRADRTPASRYSDSAALETFTSQPVRLSPAFFSASLPSEAFNIDHSFKDLAIAHDEVEVEVQTSILLSRADAITSCVGTIALAGSSAGFQAGQQVLVLEENLLAHASRLRVKAQQVFSLDVKSLARAATISTPLLQTSYAIHEVARVQKGDTCVIYDAATPSGQLAISFLELIGSKFVAIVRRESDRAHLLGQYKLSEDAVVVESDCKSRETIESAAHGKLMRLFLNCSEGDHLDFDLARSLSCSHKVNVGSVADESCLILTYGMLSRDLSRLRDIFKNGLQSLETSGHIFAATGNLHRLPYSQVVEAMQALQANSKLQQVLLYADDSLIKVEDCLSRNRQLFDTKKTYLLSGSFGDAGWVLAQWLFRKGARKLSVLVHPLCVPLPQKAISWLEQRGVDVTLHSINAFEDSGIRKWLKSTRGKIGGVIQGALAVDSLPLSDITAQRLHATVQPFFNALRVIHEETISYGLDFFLCISSIAPIVGVSSEALHSVANGYLDDFVLWRRQHGFPAALLSLGIIDNFGLFVESQPIKEALESAGIDCLNEDQLFFQLEQGILGQYPDGEADGTCDHHILSGVSFSSQDEFWSSKPIFRGLFQSASSSTGSSGAAKDLRSMMRDAKTSEDKEKALAGNFIEKIALSLSIASADINIGLPLSSYGMDSLAAVDFRKWFSQELSVNLALFEILGSGTIRAIIERVCQVFSTQEEEKPRTVQQTKGNTKAKETSVEATSEVVQPYSRPRHIPLSSFQTRQWFMDTVMEQDGNLTCGWTLSILGEPNLQAVNAAFHEVARRNEIFRTRYFEGDDMVEQEVITSVPANVEYVDISSIPDAEVQAQVYDLIGQPMDLEKGEVYRSRLVKVGDARYAWIFATHHITVDGASRQSFMEQIVACYDDVRTGLNSESSAPKLSYIDFTLWHERYLKSEQIQVDLAWWKNRLTDAPRASKLLPFAQREARGEQSSHERRVIRSKIDVATLKRMKRICSSVNVTPFHFILASLRALIFRYTAEEDFTLLVINGERPHPAFEGIIGFFVNIIPLLWKGSFDDSFESLLTQAKSLTMESMAHSQAPFDAIVDALDLGHNPAHFPLGQIALNYQMYAKSPNYTSVDFEIEDVHVTDVPTACELQFEVLEDPKTGLGFTLDYDSYLYGAADMDRFLENFMTFIGSAVRDFRQPVEELEMCGPKETQFLREVCWVEEESTADWMGLSLTNRWSDIVRRQPHATAIKTSDDKSITFFDLDKRAKDIAQLLQASGAKSGDRVGVLSHPSIDVMASMLGVSLLRCVYVPLDPSAAQGRLEYMIDNTSAPLVLHGPELDSLVGNLRGSTRAKFIAMTDATTSNSAFTATDVAEKSDDACYIVFTSGSTGKPKGVMVTFENTEAMLCGRQQIHSLGDKDTFLQQSSTSFDISMAQTWGSLTSGATMALATKDARQDVDELAGFIRDAGATMVYMTPTQLAMILENCSDILKQCHKLRAVSLIGEHLPPRLASAVYDLGLPSLAVFNEYGPSESTSQNTLYKVPYPKPNQTTVDIGRPIPNSSTYILNSKGRPVPASVSGELCIGGPQVSLGYLGRSSDAFLRNSFLSGVFGDKGWDRLYRTGDMARFRLNGNVDLQGRISGDKQVKLRGHRIDLEEIETEIRRIAAEDPVVSGITGAIVLARTLAQSTAADMTDDRQLVAFLTTKSELQKTESQAIASKLHNDLSRTLNKYMIPACYQLMTAFPMTVSGKIDRVGLNSMTLDPVFHIETVSVQTQQQPEVIEAPAAGPLEMIKGLFSGILKLPSQKVVLDTDNFFELGGQSVLALRLQKALKKELSVKVKLVDIFRNPTPTGLVKKFGLESTVDAPAVAPHAKPEIEVNWDSEIALPNDVRYLPSPAVQTESDKSSGCSPKRILILGADGYIGYYMLKFLLALHPDAKVYLLSLGDRFNLGDLFSAFTEHQMFDDRVTQTDLLTRAEIVQGAMGKERFGLTNDEFIKLGRSVDSIYHTGGFVSLLATFEELRPRNVQSVFDMIELASHGCGPRPTALHYISTWSIVHVQAWSSTSLSTENVWLDEQSVASFRPPATNDHGYFKTRWVSEMLMEEAGKRGFPTTIYRCPAHTAPTAAKCATPADNFTINMCVRMAETGLVLRTPQRQDSLESDMGMIPIDYLADTLVRLAGVEEVASCTGETLRLHITNPNSLPYSKVPDLVAQLHNGSVTGKMLDTEEWFEAITAVSNENINLELSMYKEYLDKGHIMFTINDSKTRPLLDKIDAQPGRVKCDAVDLVYLQSLLRQEQGRK